MELGENYSFSHRRGGNRPEVNRCDRRGSNNKEDLRGGCRKRERKSALKR